MVYLGDRVALTLAVLLASLSVIGHAQEPVTLAELLRSSASYVAQYEREFSAVVSEERYEQVATRPTEDLDGRARSVRETAVRLLRSDVLLINAGAAGWIGYRDVFEVDGQPVRDRDERLFKLFLEPAPDALVQAKRIADESARFNLGTENEPLTRTDQSSDGRARVPATGEPAPIRVHDGGREGGSQSAVSGASL